MARSRLQQDTQVLKSLTYADNLPAGPTLESGAVHLQDDLNSLRSQLRKTVYADSAGNWYADIPTVNGKKRAVLQLNTDLDLLEEQKILRRFPVLTDFTVPGGQNWKVLSVAGSETPSVVAAVLVSQNGAVVAQSAASGPAFNAHELTVVAGPSSIAPKNLLSVRLSLTGEAVQSDGRDVFGLLQYEASGTNGAPFNDTSGGNRAKISFVRLAAGLDSFEPCPVFDIENLSINYTFVRRTNFKSTDEADWLDDIAWLHAAGGTVSGGMPDGRVDQTGSLTIQVSPLFWEMNGTKGSFAGAAGLLVSDNATNYVFLDSLGILTINTVGYPLGAHIRLAQVLAAGGNISAIQDARSYFTSVGQSATPNLSPLNKGMSALVTGADGSLATASALGATPPSNGWISVYVNGVGYKVGNGTKAGVPCYFSGDGGLTARATGAVVAGDLLYWNGSIATFQLDASDRIDFEYEAL